MGLSPHLGIGKLRTADEQGRKEGVTQEEVARVRQDGDNHASFGKCKCKCKCGAVKHRSLGLPAGEALASQACLCQVDRFRDHEASSFFIKLPSESRASLNSYVAQSVTCSTTMEEVFELGCARTRTRTRTSFADELM